VTRDARRKISPTLPPMNPYLSQYSSIWAIPVNVIAVSASRQFMTPRGTRRATKIKRRLRRTAALVVK